MSSVEIFMVVASMLGGLALFLFGKSTGTVLIDSHF